jgi:predicted nucleic acid-binding Zn finger protein
MTHHNAHSSLVLTVLQHVSTDRLQKAVTALADSSLTMTLTRQTETEIRALVKNGEGKEYGITLTEAGVFCSCPDALYRGNVCKHATTLALAVLRGEIKEAKSTYTIHLVSQEGIALCGVQNSPHVWKWPYWPEKAWKESCTECEAIRKQPGLVKTITAAA